MLGLDTESYRASIEDILDKTILRQLDDRAQQGLDKEALASLINLLVRALCRGAGSVDGGQTHRRGVANVRLAGLLKPARELLDRVHAEVFLTQPLIEYLLANLVL